MYKKIAAIVLAIVVTLGTVCKSFACDNNMNSELCDDGITDKLNEWDGETTEVSYFGENYKITYKLNDHWYNGYNVEVSVENIGDTNIINWVLEMPFEGEITNIWNAEVQNKNDDKYIIKHQSWNRTISAGDSIKFGFTGVGAFDGFPFVIKMINGNGRKESSESCELIYRIDGEWNDGFNASIVLVNKTEKTIEDWMIEFDYDCDIKEVWNGQILNHEKNHYVIGNSGYNAIIQPNDSVVIGFLGKNCKIDEIPHNYYLSEFEVNIATSSDAYITTEEKTTEEIDTEEGNTEEKTTEEETTEEETTEEKTTEESIVNDNQSRVNAVTIDTEDFFYNENGLFYVVDSEINSLSGALSYVDEIDSLEYSVIDLYGNVVKSGNIIAQKNWVISDFALVLGYNKVEVKAISKEEKEEIVTMVDFFNTFEGNETNLDIDKSDDDEDGLNNYQENIYGTNKDIKDTDGDGLSDYEECLLVGTDPLITDSDDNGVLDSEEDFDADGLNSIQEIKYNTYVFISDSDQDGLNDGDEVNKYTTDPMKYDTDNDDLSDASDIELGFSPLLADSDGNGILDGKESIEQIYKVDFDESKNPGITGIDLQTDCSGDIKEKVIVVNAFGLDTLASRVTGLIGDPIDITLDAEFDEAKLSFHYNETELGDAKEEDLAIAWHDKKNDEIVLLEDSVVDKENNTVSYVTNHFSTYMVVNKKIFDYPRILSAVAPPVGMGNGVNLIFRAPALGSSTSREYKITNGFLNDIINEMGDDDRFEISAYNGIRGIFSSDMMYLKNISRSIFSGKPSDSLNNPLMDIVYCVSSFDNPRINGNSKGSVYILMCDGKDAKYDKMLEYYASLAKSQGIAIYFLNYGSEDSADMKMLAHKAGGYYKKIKGEGDATWAAKMIMAHNFIEDDYDPFSGQSFREDKRELPDDFIFVDGTENKDGRIIYGGLTYLSYPNGFIDLKYTKPIYVTILNRDKHFIGAAGVHDCCSDVLRDINYRFTNEPENVTIDDVRLLNRIQSDKDLSTKIGIGVSSFTGIDGTAIDVYTSYITGKGGDEKAADPQYTRKTIDVEKYIRTSNEVNSAREYYSENIKKTMLAAESVISLDNTDITISSSETSDWKGCLYYEDMGNWKENIKHNTMSIVSNIAAFGTFNDASASITAHCKYNPQTEEYTMDVRYYILDYYDYSFLDELYELDAVGIAKSYELVGIWDHTVKWKKGESNYIVY